MFFQRYQNNLTTAVGFQVFPQSNQIAVVWEYYANNIETSMTVMHCYEENVDRKTYANASFLWCDSVERIKWKTAGSLMLSGPGCLDSLYSLESRYPCLVWENRSVSITNMLQAYSVHLTSRSCMKRFVQHPKQIPKYI